MSDQECSLDLMDTSVGGDGTTRCLSMSLLGTLTGGAFLAVDELTLTVPSEGVAAVGTWWMGVSLVVTPPVTVQTSPLPCPNSLPAVGTKIVIH